VCEKALPVLTSLFAGTSAFVRVCVTTAFFLCGLSATSYGAELRVGAEQPFKTLADAVSAARAGDTIMMTPGLYLDDSAIINVALTIEGIGKGATLRVTQPLKNRKGVLVVNASLTVRNLIFEDASVTDADGKNGAGIRHQAGDLTIENCIFRGNQNGILAGADSSSAIRVRGSEFIDNGAGDGYTHALYVGAISRLEVSDSRFSGTKVGHNIKSRALTTLVRDTILEDGVEGTASYAIDLPNGGEAVLTNVRIIQGERTSNATMVAFGAENRLHPRSSLTVSNSSFSSRRTSAIGINNFTPQAVNIRHTTFVDIKTPLRGPGRSSY